VQRLMQRLILGTVVMSVLVMLVVYAQFSRTNNLLTASSPQYIAIERIQLEVTLAHLFFEEVLAGDTHETIQTPRNHLNNADAYLNALLNGGEIAGLSIPQIASAHPEFHAATTELKQSLQHLISLLENRYQIAANAQPGSALDQEFDRVFFEFLTLAKSLEGELFGRYQALSAEYLQISELLLIAGVVILLAYLLRLYHSQNKLFSQLQQVESAHSQVADQNRQLNQMALHDHLTKLPNRSHFEQELLYRIEQAGRTDGALALVFIDVDLFKQVNDNLGHQTGDLVLVEFANRLRMAVRANDFVARLAGDEFVLILGPDNTPHPVESQSELVAERVLQLMSTPFEAGEHRLDVSASLGVAYYPSHALDDQQLVKHADAAMYQAKHSGRNQVRYYSAEMAANA